MKTEAGALKTNNKQVEKQAEGAQNDQYSALKEREQDYGLWAKHVAQWPTMHEIRVEALAMEQKKKRGKQLFNTKRFGGYEGCFLCGAENTLARITMETTCLNHCIYHIWVHATHSSSKSTEDHR